MIYAAPVVGKGAACAAFADNFADHEGVDMFTSESPMMYELLRDHRDQLLREAETERLCALTTDVESLRGWTRFRYGVGDLLISIGHRMKA